LAVSKGVIRSVNGLRSIS